MDDSLLDFLDGEASLKHPLQGVSFKATSFFCIQTWHQVILSEQISFQRSYLR